MQNFIFRSSLKKRNSQIVSEKTGPRVSGGLTRHEYVTHIQKLRQAHKIIYRNYKNVVMLKANQLIDK